MSAITCAAFPTERLIVEVRAPGSEELALRTALAALVDEEGVELAISSGLFEPATHAFGFGLCHSNAWSFDLPLLDSGTGVIARSGPSAAAHALARHAIAQAAIRHALNSDELGFNTLRGDIWMPRRGMLFVWSTPS